MTRQDIFTFISENRDYLRSHFHIDTIGIFGSFARGDQSEESDIDFLIEFEENTQNLYELKAELRSYLSSHLRRRVDLAHPKYLKPFVRDEILGEAVYG